MEKPPHCLLTGMQDVRTRPQIENSVYCSVQLPIIYDHEKLEKQQPFSNVVLWTEEQDGSIEVDNADSHVRLLTSFSFRDN